MNNNIPTTLTNNNLFLSNGINGSTSSQFGVYQQTEIGFNEVSIRTLLPVSINFELYRKALIVKILFHKILTLFVTPSIFSSDIITTIVPYLGINTRSAERDTEVVVLSIRKTFLAFSSETLIQVPYYTHRLADFTYFTCRSIVSLPLSTVAP